MNDNYNFKGEVVKEYETAESAIRDLRKYIEDDDVYYKYINNIKEKYDDVDIYEINHINSILKLIEQYQILKREMEKISK
jgi:hypothetical protein